MRKFNRAILKNFKILFRKKTSLLAVIFGPLLVILLIGLAFTSSPGLNISIGYHAPDNSSLTQEIVDSLAENHETTSFAKKDLCIKQLEQGLLHTCIIFPENFVVENNKVNNITFVVDRSRISIVYAVIDSVSDKIGLKSEELSKDLASTLTSVLSETSDSIDSNLGILIKVKKNVNDATMSVEESESSIKNLDLDMVEVNIDYTDDLTIIKDDTAKLADDSIDAVEFGLEVIDNIDNNVSSSVRTELYALRDELKELNETATENYNSTETKVDDLISGLTKSVDAITEIEEKLSAGKNSKIENLAKLSAVKDQLATAGEGLEKMKSSLEQTAKNIREIKVTSADQIVNPINTNIETISTEGNQLLILFPYVLLLIIMFVGLMLSSTLVIVEKKSRASFRVFTTPTRDEFYLFTTFITSFIIVALQTIVILLLTNYFFTSLIAQNLLMNIIILILGASIFIMIGMAIGYATSTQQATNMVSISIGAILLFISNIVLPLESLSPALQNIAGYNPYVLTSEMLRRSILFQTELSATIGDLAVLLGYSILIVIIIIFAQQISKNSFFRKGAHLKNKKDIIHGFRIRGNLIDNEKEFVKVVAKLSDEDYKNNIKNSKQAKKFIKDILKKPILAKKLKSISKKDMMDEIGKDNKAKIEEIKTKSKKYKRK